MSGWSTDIHNAPQGKRLLAVVEGEVRVVRYGKTSHVPIYGFCLADQGPEDFDLCKPTAWTLLPAPPLDEAKSEVDDRKLYYLSHGLREEDLP